MVKMNRFAVYYAPEPGAFANAAASWLGWDPVAAAKVGHPVLRGLELAALTADPRRYGFHGTLKPPFRLASGLDLAALGAALAELAQDLTAVQSPRLEFVALEGFLALVPGGDTGSLSPDGDTGSLSPDGDTGSLSDLAARVVTRLDRFRAALTEAEIALRRPHLLTLRQRQLLDRYGYPHVMEEFRFHLTLSGQLTPSRLATLLPLAQAHFTPHLPQPFRIADLCLFGEAEDGRFHLLQRHPLG